MIRYFRKCSIFAIFSVLFIFASSNANAELSLLDKFSTFFSPSKSEQVIGNWNCEMHTPTGGLAQYKLAIHPNEIMYSNLNYYQSGVVVNVQTKSRWEVNNSILIMYVIESNNVAAPIGSTPFMKIVRIDKRTAHFIDEPTGIGMGCVKST